MSPAREGRALQRHRAVALLRRAFSRSTFPHRRAVLRVVRFAVGKGGACGAEGKYASRRITPDERRQLWAAARTFDKRGEAFTEKLKARTVRKSAGITTSIHPVVATFNDRNSWDAILTRHGWTTRDNEHWTQPGKTFGVSARVVIADDGSELLTVFSGNAGPLSPDGSYRTWSKFNAWAALEHRGDNRAAFIAAKHDVAA